MANNDFFSNSKYHLPNSKLILQNITRSLTMALDTQASTIIDLEFQLHEKNRENRELKNKIKSLEQENKDPEK
ncbi:hypothetical protein M3M39_05035 [Fructilactobacillus hinvesii]|uniref:Phage protein n=1 Tax=Fructilactobacillus hinvesii TaxID=2940300 RepID=A0ABY5BQV5_9LACO|nr:hypothetical protein [Fructilactobacillus hinvesii]USS87488.1 hypothetical protein M3M39_05035 [Fructilactobacillus hinvesii]